MYRCTGVQVYRCTGVQELYRCAVGVAGTISGYMECRRRFFSQLEAEVEVRRRRKVELYCIVLYCTILYCTVLHCTGGG